MALYGYLRTSRDGSEGSDPATQRLQILSVGVDPENILAAAGTSGTVGEASRNGWRALDSNTRWTATSRSCCCGTRRPSCWRLPWSTAFPWPLCAGSTRCATTPASPHCSPKWNGPTPARSPGPAALRAGRRAQVAAESRANAGPAHQRNLRRRAGLHTGGGCPALPDGHHLIRMVWPYIPFLN